MSEKETQGNRRKLFIEEAPWLVDGRWATCSDAEATHMDPICWNVVVVRWEKYDSLGLIVCRGVMLLAICLSVLTLFHFDDAGETLCVHVHCVRTVRALSCLSPRLRPAKDWMASAPVRTQWSLWKCYNNINWCAPAQTWRFCVCVFTSVQVLLT